MSIAARAAAFRVPGGLIRLCGRAIDTPDSIDVIKGRAYAVRPSTGPWVLLKTDLERHGYLDERFFFRQRRPTITVGCSRPKGEDRCICRCQSIRRGGLGQAAGDAGDNRRIFEMLKRRRTAARTSSISRRSEDTFAAAARLPKRSAACR